MRCSAAACLWVLTASLVCVAQQAPKRERKSPPSQQELDQITARGRLLEEYDKAAWHATDAVLALKSPEGSVTNYIAQQDGSGRWRVAFGQWNEAHDRFVIVYEAIQKPGNGSAQDKFKVRTNVPPLEDGGFYLVAARSIDLGRADFEKETAAVRYNVAVIPATDQNFYVYFVPAQTKPTVYPLGADVRYLVSGDGKTILEKRRLHYSLLERDESQSAKVEAGYHTAVIDDLPEDTDVFDVLRHERPVPEYVASRKYFYVINADGSIKYVGETDKVLKLGVKK